MSEYIRIADAYSQRLGGRYRKHGPSSGEDFRETVLRPAIDQGTPVAVDIDGTQNISASFYEEAFGGLVEEYGLAHVDSLLTIVAIDRAYLLPRIRTWMEDRERERLKKTRAVASA